MMHHGQYMNVLNFGIKRSKFTVTVEWCKRHFTSRGLQYSASRIELFFLVDAVDHVRLYQTVLSFSVVSLLFKDMKGIQPMESTIPYHTIFV